jgi:nitroreductase
MAFKRTKEIDMNEVLKTIATRRSARKFSPEQIMGAELEAILAAAMQAPSAHNDQSSYFAVVQNKELIDEMSAGSKVEMRKAPYDWMVAMGSNEALNIYYNAPTVIIVAGRGDAISPLVDACAAIENMLIAAESLGIGSCWIGFAKFFFTGPERNRRLGIPEGYEVHYGVALGYKSEGPAAKPPARKFEKCYHIIK